jgi:hypothetical protein
MHLDDAVRDPRWKLAGVDLAGAIAVSAVGGNERTPGVSYSVIATSRGERIVEDGVEHGVAEVKFLGLGIAGNRQSHSRQGNEFGFREHWQLLFAANWTDFNLPRFWPDELHFLHLAR